nr:hypothetical protein [Mesorhizobium sp.]
MTEATQGRQRPWHNASLGREVFLGKPAAQAAAAPIADAAKTSASPAPEPVATDPPSWEVEQRLWDEASKNNAIPYYEAYLDQFPGGRFATVARLDIDQMKAGKQTAAPPKGRVVQKTRTLKPVPHKQQQVVQRRRSSEIIVRDEPPPRDNNDFLARALIFGTGVMIGSALKH